MRVAINALYLRPGQVGGTERYLREILRAAISLEPDWRWNIFVSEEGRSAFSDMEGSVREITAPVRAENRTRRLLIEQLWLPRKIRKSRAHVCWNPGASLPVFSPGPQVTTIHDCITRHFPQNFGIIERLAIETNVKAAALRSRTLLVPSCAAAADLAASYRTHPRRIVPTPLAAGAPFGPKKKPGEEDVIGGYGLRPQGYFLSVASTLPHKNLPLLFGAYAAARIRVPDLAPLVWTGPGNAGEVQRLAAKAAPGAPIRTLGWVPAEAMAALYRGALATLLASSFEGFGLAALEALSCGSPLLTTPCPAIQEVVADAARVTQGFEKGELAAEIAELATNTLLREELTNKGPLRAATFSWNETARLTLAALRSAAYE